MFLKNKCKNRHIVQKFNKNVSHLLTLTFLLKIPIPYRASVPIWGIGMAFYQMVKYHTKHFKHIFVCHLLYPYKPVKFEVSLAIEYCPPTGRFLFFLLRCAAFGWLSVSLWTKAETLCIKLVSCLIHVCHAWPPDESVNCYKGVVAIL